MAKKKKKIKKSIKFILMIILIIIISITSINIYKNYEEKKFNIQTDTKDETEKALIQLNYTETDISTIKKDVSETNIKYLIDNKINNEIAMNIINETYYIDDYLTKYLNYYTNFPNTKYSEIITIINTHIDNEFYTNTEATDTSLGKYVILNKYYYADETYESENLVTISGEYNLYGSEFQLAEECYEAFLKMYEDAKAAGYAFKINSAYRSYNTQVSIYQGWVNKDGQELADTYSGRPGYSEHQTGYAFDIRDYPKTNDDYSKTKSFTWVSKNAYKYGFIIRFPEGKEYITGYQYESWHYRYCGIECATYIYNNDITYEEYYEYFIKYNNPRNIS